MIKDMPKDEIREINNKNVSKWGMDVVTTIEGVRNHRKSISDKIAENVTRRFKYKKGNKLQRNYSRIDKSEYCKNYEK